MNLDTTVFRVKSLAQKNGVKMKFLTAQMGVRDNYFTDCRNKGRAIPEELLKRLAIYLDTSVEYLKGETDDPQFHLESIGMTTLPYEHDGGRPVFGHASAGRGVFAQQEILGYEAVDSEYDDDDFFWLQVEGDSMAPTINDKDLVLVQRGVPLTAGGIMVVIVDDEGFVKKVSVDDDTLWLTSINPYYPPRSFSGTDLARIRCVGKVVELKRKF